MSVKQENNDMIITFVAKLKGLFYVTKTDTFKFLLYFLLGIIFSNQDIFLDSLKINEVIYILLNEVNLTYVITYCTILHSITALRTNLQCVFLYSIIYFAHSFVI